ncbi:MAG: aminoglycoside phosphotransferase family protein [Anaerolineae bacterium]|nr:aminoglycoside phosphotransferase family protein [Anaerolineae bacterium]
MNSRIETLTPDTLMPLVRQALADSTAEVTSWQVEPIHGGWGGAVGGTALYRVRGQTTRHQPWSLILKVLYERPGEAETAPYYWKREYELYRSGMLDQLPNIGLTPPTFYAFADFTDSCWIWMADIPIPDRKWTFEDYRTIARRLGRLNGAYLTGQPIPDHPWLNFHWHCRITALLTETFDRLDEYAQHPLVQRTLPLDEKDMIVSIWREAERYCDALASLPQTLCHLDAFHRNLIHRGHDTILIDWALAGRGAVGEELVAFVALSLYFPEILMSQAETLDQTAFAGYIDGLRDAGWTGDAQLVRRGYTCAMTLRGLAGVKQDIGLLLDETRHDWLRQQYGIDDLEALADFFAGIRRFRLIRMAKEARQLLGK